LLEDANSSGTVCRHNNKAYAAITINNADGTTTSVAAVAAGAFNYPNNVFNVPVVAGTGANACTATPRFKSVPRHFWATNVEWCDTALGSGPWTGYGDNAGSCQSFKDSTHVFPRFYKFGSGPTDAAYLDNVANPAMQRIDLISGNTYSYTYKSVDWTNVSGPTVTGTDTVTRTYAEEMENYANWFAYYRTRIQAVKSVVSLSFLGVDPTTSKFNVDDQFRVGLHTLSNVPTTTFVPVDDFTAAQKTSWATQLFGLSIRMAQDTPNLSAIARIGEYYRTGTSTDLNVTADPIVLSCQKNWHMLFTDGLTYQPTVPTVLSDLGSGKSDQDDTILAGAYVSDAGLTNGDPWVAPYREDTTNKISNSAADFATYYWVTDLRTDMTNNVGQSASDKANWQHVNFAAISLGTEGKLAAGDQSGVEKQLTSGALQWPTPYPTVNQPDASGVDDLWHAAVNSHGRFVNADSADEIKLGIGAILADIENTAGSRAGAALQTVNLTGTSANAYRVTFEPGWGGTVSKVNVDPSTLAEIPPAPWQVGGGKDVTNPTDTLYQQLTPTIDKPTPWYSARNIVTMHTNGTPIPFRFDQLSAAQQDVLAPGQPDRGLQVLEYLRGSAANEGTATLNFRTRISPLGDIVNASPRFVGKPNLPYQDFNDPGYSAFKTAQTGRSGMVYVAANDGMLHAFADSNGVEKFAYIPRALFRTSENAGLAALTLKEGALPPFVHHFYVDSTPKVVDVDFGSQNWHTILVGGLGKGGNAYYALDVTSPDDVVTETNAASDVLWEFSDADLGYTYGAPIITKTAGFGGKWVVIVPSGYNNASGVGKIWVLDAKTGDVLTTLSTGFGSSTSPSGLAQIAGFTQDYHNYMTDEVYGGDQYGNVWRFDLRDPDASKWTVGLFAQLTDAEGNPQPVTTAPQIEIDIANGADRWVFVGTGRLLDQSDLSDPQIQTFYALRDGTQKVPSAIVSGSPIVRSDLSVVTDATGTTGITAHGWLNDLAQYSRIVSPFQAVLSTVVYSATKPQTDPCLTGQSADVFVRNFAQGVSQIDPSGVTGTGITCTADYCTSEGGAVDAQIIGVTSDGSPTANLAVAITLGTTGKLATVPVKQPKWAYTHRLSWRILSE
jgi:type IV pilus assembly protein PilY1